MAMSCLTLFMLAAGILGICNQMYMQFYKEAADLALEDAIRHSLLVLSEYEEEQKVMTEEELYEEFLNNIVLEMGDQCNLEICIYEMDVSSGVMDMEISAEIENFYGEEKKISARKKGTLIV